MASAMEYGGLGDRNPLNRRIKERRRHLFARKSVLNFFDAMHMRHGRCLRIAYCPISTTNEVTTPLHTVNIETILGI